MAIETAVMVRGLWAGRDKAAPNKNRNKQKNRPFIFLPQAQDKKKPRLGQAFELPHGKCYRKEPMPHIENVTTLRRRGMEGVPMGLNMQKTGTLIFKESIVPSAGKV
jgi:hypothetical protein